MCFASTERRLPLCSESILAIDRSARKRLKSLTSFLSSYRFQIFIYADPKGEDNVGPYVLYRYAEGITFQELKSQGNFQDIAEAAYAIGVALARLQTISLGRSVSAGLASCQEITDECLSPAILEHRLGGAKRDRLREFVFGWLPQ